ncbi:hypothetical protein VaNZ11_008726, partial [Volvox africanus]
MAKRQQAKYFLEGPAFACTSIQNNPSRDSLHIGAHDKDFCFNLRSSIHQGTRAWAARNRSVANGSNAQLTDAAERSDGNFPTSCSTSATLPPETICINRLHLRRTVTQLGRNRSCTDKTSNNSPKFRSDVNNWPAVAWHAMRSTLASVTMPSASTPHAHQHSTRDNRFPDSASIREAGVNDYMTVSGAISGCASGITRDSSPVSCTASTVATGRRFGLVGSGNGGQGGSRGGADGGSDGGGAGWAAGQRFRGAPQALFSLARGDDADQPRLRGHRGWSADVINGTGRRGGGAGIGASGMSAGLGGDLDMAKAEAVLADLMRDGRSGGGGGGEAALDGGSGDEADPGRAAAAEAVLSRLECGFCHRRLSSWRRSRGASAATLLCDGCHRGFHADCCRYRGLDPRPRRRRQLTEGSGEGAIRLGHAGPSPAPGGRTWLLAASELYGLKGAVRQEALEALQQASAVLSAEYGPRVVDAVLDSDYALVLRDARGTAVSAATVDVYGREVVVMDLAATSDDAHGRGHFRALVASLESWLDEATTQRWVVTLAPGKDGKAAQRMWREHGFRPLPARQAHAWARQLPGFPDVSGRGAVLLERRMAAGGR